MLTYHTLLPHDSDMGSFSSDGFSSWQVAEVIASCLLPANSSAVDMLEINYLEEISGIKYKSLVLELEILSPFCKLIWQLVCLILPSLRAKSCLGFVLDCI